MDIQQWAEKYQLSADELRILEYMKRHHANVRDTGIRDLAKATYSSPGFIIKLAKKIGLSGYSELVFLMADTDTFVDLKSSPVDIGEYLHPFYECMKKHRGGMISVLGSGYSESIAQYMSEYLNVHGFRSTSNSHLELLRPSSDHLLITISNSGDTVRLNELAEQAAENGQDVIAFAGRRNSQMANAASIAISTNTFKPTSFEENAPQLFFGFALIYFELLMSKTLSMLGQD